MPIQKEKTNEGTNIKKIFAVMSGKGGVGKSTVTSLTAVALKEKDYKVGILDADITGPSIPKLFGINERRAETDKTGIYPVDSESGIKIMSLNLLLEQEESPVIWRAPLITSTIKQFYTDVTWGDLDFLLIDLPPGTGDVPLTIMQSIPVDGIIIVSSPQELVQLIVRKSINMAIIMNTKVVGIVENMSYVICPHCKEEIKVFGESGIEDLAKDMGLDLLVRLPIDPEFAKLSDEGKIEHVMKTDLKHKTEANKIIDKIMSI
ncbi:MAG: Mrp/NBP35 family ATP-binding protein [Caulobacteraceae bacterium]